MSEMLLGARAAKAISETNMASEYRGIRLPESLLNHDFGMHRVTTDNEH